MVPSWRQNRAQDGPRRPQDVPKTATWLQLAAQDGPRRLQDAPKTRPRRPLGPNLPPKSPPSWATTVPRRPKTAQIAPQTASWPQLRTRIAEILPRTNQRTRTLSTTPKERQTSQRSASKLAAERKRPNVDGPLLDLSWTLTSMNIIEKQTIRTTEESR